jgi:hypothetical protein
MGTRALLPEFDKPVEERAAEGASRQ